MLFIASQSSTAVETTESFDLWEDILEIHLAGFKAIVGLVTFEVTVSD